MFVLPRLNRLHVQELEAREVPAAYSLAGTVLTIDLNTAGETLTFKAGTPQIDVTGSVAASGASVAGFFTLGGNNATILSTVTEIIINDSADNGQIFFADSGTTSYSQSFNITLNNGANTRVEFLNGTSSFNQDFTTTAAIFTSTNSNTTVTLNGGTSDFTVTGTNSILLPGALTVPGNLSVSAGGTLSQPTSTSPTNGINVSGNATFSRINGTDAIRLNANFNRVNGTVSFLESGGTISDIEWLNAASNAQTPDLSALTNLNTLMLSHFYSSLQLGTINPVTTSISLQAFGNITQTTPLTTGTLNATVLGNSAITLNAANAITSLRISSVDSNQIHQVTDSGGLAITSLNLGRAGLTLDATGGTITQTGAITQLPNAGTVTINSTGNVSLNANGNVITGNLVIASATTTSVTIQNDYLLATTSNITLPTSLTNLTVNFLNSPMILGSFVPTSVTSLSASGLGIYQTAALTIPTLNVNGMSGPIVLNNPANNFDFIRLRNSPTEYHDVTLVNSDSLMFAIGNTSLGGSRNSITALSGNITQANSISVGALSTTTFNAPAATGTVNLNIGNTFAGRVEATAGSGNITLVGSGNLILGNITTTVGNAVFTSVSGTVQQYPGTKLNLGGTSATLTATNGSNRLTNPGNQFAATLALNSAVSSEIISTTPITLGTSSPTALQLTAGGSISQTGPITATGISDLTSTSGSITLTNAGNDFGQIGFTVSGANNVGVTDTNGIILGTTTLGSGALTVNATGPLSQTGPITQGVTGGPMTFNAGAVNLTLPTNDIAGPFIISGGAVSLLLNNRRNIDLSASPIISASAFVSLTAQNQVKLPATSMAAGNILISAAKIELPGQINLAGSFTASGATSILSGSVITGASADFQGDVTVGGPLNFGLSGLLTHSQGTWNQGANNLTGVGGISQGTNSILTTSGTPTFTVGSSGFTITTSATLQIGTNATAAESLTVNTTGAISISGALQVGLGTTTDRLIKTGTGNVILNGTLIGTGIATVAPQPIINVTGGLVTGAFLESIDPVSTSPKTFNVVSDQVIANYTTPTAVTISQSGPAALGGTVSGFFKNGQGYTVTSSLGAAAGLVVSEAVDTAGNDLGLDISVRNNSAPSTLTITTTPGYNGTGTIAVRRIGVNGPGSLSINAPTANFTNGIINIDGALTSLTARDITNTRIFAGGASTTATTLTGKEINSSNISVGGAITSLTAEQVVSARFLAEKFGTIKTTGNPLQGQALGNFNARLTTRTTTMGLNLASVTIAGTLSGVWDIFGDIGVVKTRITGLMNIGEPVSLAGATTRNFDGIRNIASLDVGLANASSLNVSVTGHIKSVTATEWAFGSIRAKSIGTVITKTDATNGGNGNWNAAITTLDNTGGNAIGSMTVAGDLNTSLNGFNIRNGNIGAIKVAKTLIGTINATSSPTSGSITSLTVGRIINLTVNAKRIGSISAVANPALQQFGDLTLSTFNLSGNDGTKAKNAIGKVTASRNIQGINFTLRSGNIPSIAAGYTASANNWTFFDSTAGRLGSFTAGESLTNIITAESVGVISVKGAKQSPITSAALNGNMSGNIITTFRESGGAAGIGAINVAGDLGATSNLFIAPNGITAITVGRAISNLTIATDSLLAGNDVIGRIGSITAGSISTMRLSGESVGNITVKGYATPEGATVSRVAGVLDTSTIIMRGAGVKSGVGVGAISVDTTSQSTTINAPYGVTSWANKAKVTALNLVADITPLNLSSVKPGFGRIGSVTTTDLVNSAIIASTIGTITTKAGYNAFTTESYRGTISAAAIVSRNANAAVGIGSITTDGSINSSVIYAPATVNNISVDESVLSTTIGTGLALTAKTGSMKFGEINFGSIISRQIGSINVVGNLNPTSTLGGGVTNSFINVFGNSAGVGLGSFNALGTVSNSRFDVSDGNLTTFTAARLKNSRIQVGARFTKANVVTGSVSFSPTDRVLGSLKITAPALTGAPLPLDVQEASGFQDSYVAAATIGSTTLTNSPSTNISAIETQGLVFRTGAPASGPISIAGVIMPLNTALIGGSKFANAGI